MLLGFLNINDLCNCSSASASWLIFCLGVGWEGQVYSVLLILLFVVILMALCRDFRLLAQGVAPGLYLR